MSVVIVRRRGPPWLFSERFLVVGLVVAVLHCPRVAGDESRVGDLRAHHSAGQTFLTWSEGDLTEIPEDVSVLELRRIRRALDDERKVRFRIYRSAEPIATVEGLEPIAEVPPLTCWNLDYHGISPRPEDRARLYVIRDGGEPLPVGIGLYVHNPAAPGEAFFAVTRVEDGVEQDTLSASQALGEPVLETVGPGLPVLQRIERPETSNYVENPELHYFVRWEAPPRANTENRPFDYRVGIPPGRVRPALLGLHLHCWGANLDGGYIWWYGASDGAIQVASNQIPYDWWIGYHEKHGLTDDWTGGVVRDYTVKRLLSFADWVSTRWEVDASRTFVTGASMGGSGASMIAVRYPERFAYALSSVGVHIAAKSPQFTGSYEGVCGKVGSGVLHESGLEVFHYLDNAFLVRRDPTRDLPLISFTNGKNDSGIGWPQALEFARALQAARQPHIFTWGQSGHGQRVFVPTPTGGGDGGPSLRGYLDVRLGRSLPAFTNCSLDGDPGDGDPDAGAPEGQLNRYLRWDTGDTIDEPERYELAVYLTPDAPRDVCTVDITPRRLVRFRPLPGERFDWRSVARERADDLDSAAPGASVAADAWGLVTLKGVTVSKAGNRLRIVRSEPTRGEARATLKRPARFPHRVWAAADFEVRLPDYAWFGPAVTDDVPAYAGNSTALGVGERPYRDHAALMTGVNPVPGPRMGRVNSLYLRYRLGGATEATFQHFSLSSEDNNHVRVAGLTEGSWDEVTMCFSRDGRRNDGTTGVPFEEGERMDDLKVFVGKPGDGGAYDLLVDDVIFFSDDPALPPEPEPFPRRVIYLAAFDTGITERERPKYFPGTFEVAVADAPAGAYWGAARAVAHEPTRGKWIRLELTPHRTVGAHTKLRFRYHLTGSSEMTVQIFDVTDQDNRHVRLRGLEEGEWQFTYVDFTRDARRNDGSDTPFAVGHTVDDLFFFVARDAELFVDEVCLFDAGEDSVVSD